MCIRDRFVKSQHNVEIQYAVEATVQPVACLTKYEIRNLLEYFNMPQELICRKAFPGPALAARIVGPVSQENLAFEKKVHDIVESKVDDYYKEQFGKAMIINAQGEQEPFQVFAATIEDVSSAKVTGVFKGRRSYTSPLCIKENWDYSKLTKQAEALTEHARLFFELGGGKNDGKFDVVIRCVNSLDARTATVTDLPFELLQTLQEQLTKLVETRTVYFDVTPKPPGTIEYV